MKDAAPGDVIDLAVPEDIGESMTSRSLVYTSMLQVKRIAIPAGKSISEHTAPGEMTVHCLHGRMRFSTPDQTVELESHQMLYLLPGALHRVDAIADSAFLLTIVRPSAGDHS